MTNIIDFSTGTMLIALTHCRKKTYKLVANGDNDDDQSFAVCAAYGRERRLRRLFRLPDSEKPGHNSNLEQPSGFRYAEIVQLAPKNLSEVARVTMAILGSGAKL
jgi:hypothetical protein